MFIFIFSSILILFKNVSGLVFVFVGSVSSIALVGFVTSYSVASGSSPAAFLLASRIIELQSSTNWIV